VAFLDDDDLWLAGNMEPQLAALEANPRAGFAYGLCRFVTDDLEPLAGPFPSRPLPSGFAPDELHLSYPQIGVVLFRRDALVAAGGYDQTIRYYEDADLMLRIAARQEIVAVDRVGMAYRERSPSKQRCDYFWGKARREVTQWRPRDLGVTRRTAMRFRFRAKGLFCWRFCLDAAAALEAGRDLDALVCLSRAARISPVHALHHSRVMTAIFRQCIARRRPSPELATDH
jgi:hypothetical protein